MTSLKHEKCIVASETALLHWLIKRVNGCFAFLNGLLIGFMASYIWFLSAKSSVVFFISAINSFPSSLLQGSTICTLRRRTSLFVPCACAGFTTWIKKKRRTYLSIDKIDIKNDFDYFFKTRFFPGLYLKRFRS